MKFIMYIFLLIFNPKRLKVLVVEDAIEQNKIPHEKKEQYQNLKESIDHIRKGLYYSLLFVLGTTIIGVTVGRVCYYFFGYLSNVSYAILQYIGLGIILWATLAIQGWKIQTIGGHSLPELINEWVYRLFYLIGTFLLVLSVSWPTQ